MNLSDTDAKNFTRGGQITLHNLRMYAQIMDKVVVSAALIFLFVTIGMIWTLTSSYERYVFGEYCISQMLVLIDERGTTSFMESNNVKKNVHYRDIIHSDIVRDTVKVTSRKAVLSLIAGLLSGIISLSLISRWLRKRGEKQAENIFLKGDTILPASSLKKIIERNEQQSTLSLAKLPLIKNTETEHLLFHGTTGSGKSNAIKELWLFRNSRGFLPMLQSRNYNFY